MPDARSETVGESVSEIGVCVRTARSETDGVSFTKISELVFTKSVIEGESLRILIPARIVS